MSRTVRRFTVKHLIAAFGLALGLAACSDSPTAPPTPVRADRAGVRTASLGARSRPRTLDGDFARIDSLVPGFGGFYASGPGEITAYLTDVGREAELRAALGTVYGLDRRFVNAKLVIRQGRYGFAELRRMQARMLEVLGRRGLVYTDIDERRNRVTFGVEGATRAHALAGLAPLKLPTDAYAVVATSRVRLFSTLRDQVSPVPAGVLITAQGSGKECSLGVSADQGGFKYYVTASHCTDVQGGTEGTEFHQPAPGAPGGSTYLGYEYADPAYVGGGFDCPQDALCRYSDAALIAKADNHDARLGAIARTTYVDPNTGSIDLDPQYPDGFRVVGKAAYPMEGDILQKVGAATGWTQGLVSVTCTTVYDGNYVLLCMDKVDGGAGPGDSGAPVFSAEPGFGSSDVVWYGIVQGGSNFGSYYMSSVSNIESELGSLTVTF